MAKMQLENYFKAVDQVTGPMKKMSKSVTGFSTKTQKSFKGMNAGIGKMRGLIRGVVAVLATGAIVKAIGGFAKKGDEIAKTARQIGLTAEALQELRFAAERQGMTTEEFTKSIETMNKYVGQARVQTGTLYTQLKKSNPALLEQLNTVESSEKAFNLLVEEIANTPSEIDKAALATAAFGRSGQGMIVMAENGAAGIAALREEARKYGDIISRDAAAASERFVDSLTNLKAALNGIKNNVLGPLIDAIQPVIQNIADWAAANRELISQKVGEIIGAVMKVFESLAPVLAQLWPIILQIVDAISELLPMLSPLIKMLGEAFVDILKTLMPFIKTLIDLLIDLMPPIINLATSVLPPLIAILKPILKVVESLLPIFNVLAKVIGTVLVAEFELLSAVLEPVLGWISKIVDALSKFLIPVIEKVADFIKPITKVLGGLLGKKTEIVLSEEQDAARKRVEEIKQQLKIETDPKRVEMLKREGENLARALMSSLENEMPMPQNAAMLQSMSRVERSYTENRSTVDVNFNNTPAGTRIRQTGKSPGINLDPGYAGGR